MVYGEFSRDLEFVFMIDKRTSNFFFICLSYFTIDFSRFRYHSDHCLHLASIICPLIDNSSGIDFEIDRVVRVEKTIAP